MILFVTMCVRFIWFYDILLQDLFVVGRGDSSQNSHSTPICGEPSKLKVNFSFRAPLLFYLSQCML